MTLNGSLRRRDQAPRSPISSAAEFSSEEGFAHQDSDYFAVELVSAALCLTIIFLVGYLLSDYRVARDRLPYLLALDGFQVFFALAVGGLLWTSRLRRHWRLAFCVASAVCIAATTMVSLLTNNLDELGFLVLGLVSAGGFLLPWNARWQASFSLVGLGAMVVAEVCRLSSPVPAVVRWLMLLASIGVGQLVIRQRESYRRKLGSQLESLAAIERKLRAEIVEREAAQNQLKQREGLLREIFDASPDVISVLNLKTETYTYLNREFGLSGYSKKEMLGKPVAELGIFADPAQLASLFTQLRLGKTVRDMEFQLRRKDGTLLPFIGSFRPVEVGGELSAVAVVRDISALKRAQQGNAFWAAVFKSSLVAIATSTPDFVYNGWNAAAERLYGYSAGEALGKSVNFIVANGRVAAFGEALEALRRGDTVRELEQECVRKDGRPIVCSFTMAPVHDEGGRLIGYSAVSYDVTARREAEQRLAEREAKFRDIFNHSPDPVSLNSLKDGRFLDINDRWTQLFGFARHEVLGRRPIDLGIWADVNHLRAVDRLLRGQRRVINYETSFRLKDRRQFVALFSAVVTELNGAEIALCFVRDISDRKTAERKLAESEARLRQLFETSPDAIVVSSLANNQILEVNPAFVAMSGFTPEEALGSTALDLNLWVETPELQAFFAELEGEGLVKNAELLMHSKRGWNIPVLVSAVKGSLAGQPSLFVVARDITELKRAQAELKASEEKFRQVFDCAPDSIVVADLKTGEIVDLNAESARRVGLRREEMIGKTSTSLGMWVKESDYALFRESLRTLGYVRDQEVVFRNSDGTFGPRLLNSSKVRIGERSFVVTVSRDISALKEIERQLIESREAALASSKAKSQFLSSMSHEIRTPMSAIVGASDVLSETPLNTEQRKYVEVILSNAHSLLDLINNILDLARIESGRMELEHSDFDLRCVVEEVAQALALRAHEKGLELTVRIVPDVPTALTGDAMRLRQVLVNLLGNAIKFTARGGITVTVERVRGQLAPADAQGVSLPPNDGGCSVGEEETARAPGTTADHRATVTSPSPSPAAAPASGPAAISDSSAARVDPQVRLHFAISDTGIGIPRDKLKAIFMDFTQVDSSTTRANSGTGLGLAIVRRLVELSHGQVWVESELGKGSTFHLMLPFERRSEGSEEYPATAVDLGDVRVLVVDDARIDRLVAKENLAAAGARVEEASCGVEALAAVERAAAESDPFDLVLVDARMPGMDGFEVARSLLKRDMDEPGGYAPAVVLMLTSDDLSKQLARTNESGVNHHLVKPIKVSELWSVVAGALGLTPQKGLQGLPSGAAVAASEQMKPKSLRILLAEDSVDNRLIVKAYLAHTPHKLDMVENGEQAVARFMAAAGGGNGYDVVLMDVQMPVMDGHAATRMIRQWELDQRLAKTPIVALTASAFAHDVNKSLEAGCDAHVSKPVRKAALLAAIERVCARGEPAFVRSGDVPQSGERALGMHGRFMVQVVPALASLAPAFLRRKREDLASVQKALERGDYETIRRLGHTMKGEGAALGFDLISEIGGLLESAAEAGDVSSMRKQIAVLTEFLAHVQIVGLARG
jgi:PAS domain S-box-containing protein